MAFVDASPITVRESTRLAVNCDLAECTLEEALLRAGCTEGGVAAIIVPETMYFLAMRTKKLMPDNIGLAVTHVLPTKGYEYAWMVVGPKGSAVWSIGA